MNVQAVIEIPKGNDRRWHLNYAQTAIEDFGPIRDVIPVNDGRIPVAYGFIEGIFNHDEVQEGPLKENVDVLVFSERSFEIGEKIEVVVFGIINCDDSDHKVLAYDASSKAISWEEVLEEERNLITEFFGYKHKITSIGGTEEAEVYLEVMKKTPFS